MKNKAGKLIGFAIGLAGFMAVFKVFFLPYIPREDEVPPGLVLIMSIITGLLFSLGGHLLQNYLQKKTPGLQARKFK